MTAQVLSLSRALRKNGYRLTQARRAIVETLVASESHITADELAKKVRQKTPSVGRMTVYRTLELLSELGLIRPIYQGTGAAHYILMNEGHHHHLVCSICDSVIEIESCAVREIEQDIGHHYSFEIEGHLLEIYGRCSRCQQPSGA